MCIRDRLREELKILKEREKVLHNLINIKIKFDNEEIFYNMIKTVSYTHLDVNKRQFQASSCKRLSLCSQKRT